MHRRRGVARALRAGRAAEFHATPAVQLLLALGAGERVWYAGSLLSPDPSTGFSHDRRFIAL
jgi:hypothetical protein